jgi:hypothetical protein
MSDPLARVALVTTKEATTMRREREPWAEVLTLGDVRFGILAGGPFDGRCFPLPGGIPEVLEVPGPIGDDQPRTVRYALREGLYRYAPAAPARSAA